MKRKLVFSLLGLLAAFSAHAEEGDLYSQCVDKQGTINNSVVALCSEEASEVYKASITKSYRKIYATLKASDPQEAAAFEQAQMAWITYRDQHCKMMGSYVGSPMYAFCPMQLNRQRAQELAELAESF